MPVAQPRSVVASPVVGTVDSPSPCWWGPPLALRSQQTLPWPWALPKPSWGEDGQGEDGQRVAWAGIVLALWGAQTPGHVFR